MGDERTTMKWIGTIDTALCVAACGWSTEDERIVYRSALAFIQRVRNEAMERSIKTLKCRTCGK